MVSGGDKPHSISIFLTHFYLFIIFYLFLNAEVFMPWGGSSYIAHTRYHSNPIEDKLDSIGLFIDKASMRLSQSVIKTTTYLTMLPTLITNLEENKLMLNQLITTDEYAHRIDLYNMKIDILTQYALKLSTELAALKPSMEEMKEEKVQAPVATIPSVMHSLEEHKVSTQLQATRKNLLGTASGPLLTIALYLTARDSASAASASRFFCAFFYSRPLNDSFVLLSQHHGLFFNLSGKKKPTLRKFNRELKEALKNYHFANRGKSSELPKTILQFADSRTPRKLM